MSVLVQTSFGDLTIDLNYDRCPVSCKNFIKLCKIKHYNNALFIQVQKNYITQLKTKQATTIFKQALKNNDYRYFEDEVDMDIKINKLGLVCTSNLGPNLNDSQFFITLTKDHLSSLNGKHSVFGKVEQGLDILRRINQSFVDEKGRPYMNIRILHTHVLFDPFQDLPGMVIPSSPLLEKDPERLQAFEHQEMAQKGKTQEDLIKAAKEQKAKKQTVTLEILGDLPDADAKPPENVLFICKLNPVTEERDLEIIFSRFGTIKCCQVVRDWKTGQSLQYGFIEYETPQACQEAYLKMQNVLIDDRRIHVDFCQSVSKLWPRHKKGVGNPLKKSGESKEAKPKELVPKFRQGKQYYGDKSNKYDIVLKNQPRVQSSRPEQEQKFKEKEVIKQKTKQRSRERKSRSREKKKQKKHKQERRRQSSESSRDRKRKKYS